jgi:hypothetical protein
VSELDIESIESHPRVPRVVVGEVPRTTYVMIKPDFTALHKALNGMVKSIRQFGMNRRQTRAEWRNAADQINVWESEGGAL